MKIDESKYTMQEHPNGDILLKKIPEKKAGLWRPRDGESYWFVPADLSVVPTQNTGHKSEYNLLAAGNCYQTKGQAEKAASLMRRASIFISAALNADPDAGEWAEDRPWSVINSLGNLEVYKHSLCIDQPAWVHTKEQATHMLEILEAEGWK